MQAIKQPCGTIPCWLKMLRVELYNILRVFQNFIGHLSGARNSGDRLATTAKRANRKRRLRRPERKGLRMCYVMFRLQLMRPLVTQSRWPRVIRPQNPGTAQL